VETAERQPPERRLGLPLGLGMRCQRCCSWAVRHLTLPSNCVCNAARSCCSIALNHGVPLKVLIYKLRSCTTRRHSAPAYAQGLHWMACGEECSSKLVVTVAAKSFMIDITEREITTAGVNKGRRLGMPPHAWVGLAGYRDVCCALAVGLSPPRLAPLAPSARDTSSLADAGQSPQAQQRRATLCGMAVAALMASHAPWPAVVLAFLPCATAALFGCSCPLRAAAALFGLQLPSSGCSCPLGRPRPTCSIAGVDVVAIQQDLASGFHAGNLCRGRAGAGR